MSNLEETTPETTVDSAEAERQAIQQIVQRAQGGDIDAVAPLRTFLRERPGAIMALGGDLAWEALAAQVLNYSGRDLSVREAVHQQLEKLRDELRGETGHRPGIERLLIDRVVSEWLFLHSMETLYASQQKPTLDSDDYYQKVITLAHQRYISAITCLARVRKYALPAVQINLANEQVNVAGNLSAAPPG